MSENHNKSAYLRYFKAKLLVLAKPSIWGTAIFLSAIGLVIREYWSNPNMSTYKENQEIPALQSDGSNLSAEDRAIAADLDNLPALLNDAEPGNLPVIAPLPPLPPQPNNSDNVLGEINKQGSSNAESKPEIATVNDIAPPMGKNPFVTEAEQLLQSGTFNVNDQPLGIKPLPTTSPSTDAKSSQSGDGVNETAKSESSEPKGLSLIPLSELSNLSVPSVGSGNQINPLAPTPVGGVTQIAPSLTNPGLNPVNGVQPTAPIPTNLPPNSGNNFDSIPELPSAAESTMSGVQTNRPSSAIQPPSSVNQISPVVADRNGNLIWRSPAEQMQVNSSDIGELSKQDLEILEQIRNSGD
ncbi:hypothetical protein VB620_14940 [Nodularia harveyana UHCC-0300]|uniref:Uncharacterized protein n=1 Tax=Nodularia harveyana UHCC-0300 TaxID=2974287 RepID=A0ABU5UGM3_9CYAN|nr:hypothetical protein [Nodularia harveyana]MEA5582634.1 hypothetical protein [Nodularia harveyana UHCC-0300]